jgi:hypothetical protein
MDYSFFYRDPITGEIDLEQKKIFDKMGEKFSNRMKRDKKRINFVTEKLNPPSYFMTTTYLSNLKDVPVTLYEPSLENRKSSINLLDYIFKYLEKVEGIKYKYEDHKKAISSFVKIFNIEHLRDTEPEFDEKGRGRRSGFKDEKGNRYFGQTLWFFLCREILKTEKTYHRKQIIKKLNEDGK